MRVFGEGARKLAGLAGVMFGWSPDAFWGATPAELGALVEAMRGGTEGGPPDAGAIAGLREEWPDG